MEVRSCFLEIKEQDFFKLVGSTVKYMERIVTKKMNTINTVQCLEC